MVLIVENDKFLDAIPNKVRNLSNLNKYEIPKEIFFVDQFIETGTKKIQRKKTLDLIFKK